MSDQDYEDYRAARRDAMRRHPSSVPPNPLGSPRRLPSFVEKVLIVLGGFFVMIVMFTLFLFLVGWLVMLGFGVLHSEFPVVPAIGYWTAIMTAIGIRLISFAWTGISGSADKD